MPLDSAEMGFYAADSQTTNMSIVGFQWSKLRPWLVAGGWIVVTGSMHTAVVLVDLNHNLFDWRPDSLDLTDLIASAACAVCIAGSVWLAKWSDRPLLVAVGALGAIWLIVFGVILLPAETLSPGTVLGRDAASPLWFRGGRLFVLSLPGAMLAHRVWSDHRGAGPSDQSPMGGR